jgi:hypothetical protein
MTTYVAALIISPGRKTYFQLTILLAITAFLESVDFEDAICRAVSLGGDADTLAAITGSIAEAFYGGVPDEIAAEVEKRLPADLWEVVERFNQFLAERPKQQKGSIEPSLWVDLANASFACPGLDVIPYGYDPSHHTPGRRIRRLQDP